MKFKTKVNENTNNKYWAVIQYQRPQMFYGQNGPVIKNVWDELDSFGNKSAEEMRAELEDIYSDDYYDGCRVIVSGNGWKGDGKDFLARFTNESLTEDVYTDDIEQLKRQEKILMDEIHAIQLKYHYRGYQSDYNYKWRSKEVEKIQKQIAKLEAENKGEKVLTKANITNAIKKISGLDTLKTRTTGIRGYRPVTGGSFEVQKISDTQGFDIYFYNNHDQVPQIVDELNKQGYKATSLGNNTGIHIENNMSLKNESLTEATNDEPYIIYFFDNTAGRERRKVTVDDIDDFHEETFTPEDLANYVQEEGYDSIEEFITDKNYADVDDGSQVIYLITRGNDTLVDNGSKYFIRLKKRLEKKLEKQLQNESLNEDNINIDEYFDKLDVEEAANYYGLSPEELRDAIPDGYKDDYTFICYLVAKPEYEDKLSFDGLSDLILVKDNTSGNLFPAQVGERWLNDATGEILNSCSDNEYDDDLDESLNEDTIKQNGKWVNKGKEGTHGKFKTKKAADAQRKAMFANGYKEGLEEANYGGAFDIENDQFFTREEINEFAYDLVDDFKDWASGEFSVDPDEIQLRDVYMTSPIHLVVEIDDNGAGHTAEINIDMRRIRKPSDIYKYTDSILTQWQQSYLEYHPECFDMDESLSEELFDDDYDQEFYSGNDGYFYKEICHKMVYDSDGFTTDYTGYMKVNPTGKDGERVSFVFVFGDNELYRPEEGNYDFETDSFEEAQEWFDSYNGFDEDDDDYYDFMNDLADDDEVHLTLTSYDMHQDDDINEALDTWVDPRSKQDRYMNTNESINENKDLSQIISDI